MGDPRAHAIENPVEAILAASPDFIKILSADGVLRFVNDSGLELMEGESQETLRGTQYADLWPEDMRREVTEAIKGAANGETTRIEGYCPTLKGSPRWWETHFRGVRSSPDVGTEVIGVTWDISARRSRELLLRANEERFALFVESAGDGICEANPRGLCTFINSSGAGMLGYKPEELVGRLLHETIHHHRADGSPYAQEDCPILRATQTRHPIRVDDEVFWHKDGHPVPTCYSAYPIDSRSSQGGVVLTFDDRSEQKRIEDDLGRMASRLSEADRRTNEFIAILAHELRNPLAPIRTGLQLMRRAGDHGAAAAGHVREMMERQVSHMVHLIGDLLDIARVTSGKMELKKERVELHRVVDTALEAVVSPIGNANHALTVDLPPQPIYIDGDAIRLAQIFTNILHNAAKYTAAGGRIAVTATLSDRQVSIDIGDTGIGIAQDSLASIFDMFTTVGRHAEGSQGGLGIGLNLVRRLVELHGGGIVATSEGLGKGSHFLVTLPLTSAGSTEFEQATHRIATAVPPPRAKVLLVDDNVDAAASLSLLLELENHVTRIANSGAEALQILSRFKPDVVLLDLGMPGMNGYEVARAIRKLPDAGNPVLVALTGWGGEADRIRSKNAGFDEHLTKPADIDTIEKLLAKLGPSAR